MAVTNLASIPLECGKTLDELSDYLAADRIPYDPHVETCPDCLNALTALARLAELSRDLISHDAEQLPPAPENWLRTILASIRDEIRAGRSLPIHHADPRARITVTEGAVRALIRSAGDDIDGLVIGKCEFVGDVEQPGAAVEVNVGASIAWGRPFAELYTPLRELIYDLLHRHTELNVTSVNVTIEDIHGFDPALSGHVPS
jgi:uncharacterized alkaline shock family protein YloU